MDKEISLETALLSAKSFKDFNYVLMAVSLHPEWLTTIPDERRWAILHHIILSGNVAHLEQLLALQKFNKTFRLMVDTRNNETILDIAKLRDNQTQMLERIERLIKLDELLNYAKDGQWDKCYDIVEANPDYGNEKPPYRRFYLVHHMACINAIKEFEEFAKIKGFKFNLTLQADRKKINVVAREHECNEFAQYLEENYPLYFNKEEVDDKFFEPTEEAKRHTDDIIAIMENRSIPYDPEPFPSAATNIHHRHDVDNEVKHKMPKKPPPPTDRDNFIAKHSVDTIRKLLLCSLTNAIVTDPVVAADGFTYERTAIENWMDSHKYSPMTNEKFAHKHLSSNVVVKQILTAMSQQ